MDMTKFIPVSSVSFYQKPHEGLEDIKRHWMLGMGPCGKVIDGLRVTIAGGALVIHQQHQDTSEKIVAIPLHLINSAIHFEE
ncbi:hypothetical protein [Chromobacterium haemolyticum]|uniref:hypothetical protein n=1 Tax=Chromobacterium TaxID=535 RepID=UPI0040568512